jgi:hypothetical protein
MATTRTRGDVTSVRTPVQTAALVVSVVFLLVGVLGFIPGITTNYGGMTFAGHHSDAHLLGVFQVLGLGMIALGLITSRRTAR